MRRNGKNIQNKYSEMTEKSLHHEQKRGNFLEGFVEMLKYSGYKKKMKYK